MMHCVVIIKSILDWNKNTKSWFNKYWYSQIASVVGCHYNTVKKAMKIVLSLWLDNERKFSSYQWMDFIIFLFKRRKEASNKTRTILWLYKANAIEGQLSKRYENKPKKTFDKPIANNPPDETKYFTKGF